MQIQPTDHILHLSFDDEAFGRADIFCGHFNKRQVASKTYKPLEFSATKLPFKDKSFDLVMATNVLAYAHQPFVIFEEIKRISRRAHLRERSEFAEVLFGWPDTRWIVSVENMQLVIKSKNEQKMGKFGPFFHGLYANDPTFFDYISQAPGLMNVSVDWHEEDDIVEEEEYFDEEFVLPDIDERPSEGLFEDIDSKSDERDQNDGLAKVKKVKKTKRVVKTILRPCQTEYVDNVRIKLGKITDQINVRNLSNKNLQQ